MKPVSDQELAIVREIWSRGTATIREITDALYDEGTAPQYVERPEEKRCVRRVRDIAMDAIRRRHPDLADSEVHLMLIELTYGKSLGDDIRRR